MRQPPTASLAPTERTHVRRHRDRASYELEEIRAILDEGMICHVAVAIDGQPWMIPTAYGRRGDELLLHGAAGNHILKAACGGSPVSVTVTLLDGVVLARSTMHHSLNYRSVILFGQVSEITHREAKVEALGAIVEHLLPGRTAEARPPNDAELRATRVASMPIDEASAKIRTGPPVDDPHDAELPVWAGVLPLRLTAGPAIPDATATALPPSVSLRQPGRWASAD